MIKIKAKNGEMKGTMKGNPFEILNDAIAITKVFYTTFNKRLPNFGEYYLHLINEKLKENENEEPTDFEKELTEIIEDMRKVVADDIEEEGKEENEEDNSVYSRHKRHRRH